MTWWSKRSDKLDAEIRQHLEFETQLGIEAGLSPEEARYAAMRKFGNVSLAKEESREVWGLLWMERLWQDVRYALRGFWHNPGFTLVALLSLALGIGACTSFFSVIYGVLIAPYPYAHPDKIWAPAVTATGEAVEGWHRYSKRELREIEKLPAFEQAMATGFERVLLKRPAGPESFVGILLTGNAFDFIGVKPLLGRTIEPFDVKADGQTEPVVVLSYLAWRRLFSGNADAIGQKLIINDQPRTIIGVMPARFGWWTQEGIWMPMPMDIKDETPVNVIMRLRDGVTPAAAEQQLQSLNLQLAQAKPQTFPRHGFHTTLLNYMDITQASGEMTQSLRLLFVAVGLLLLIACVNVANLQLARTTSRVREIAVRLSIGAGRRRLVRQLLTESLALSLVGGGLGILFALAATRVITLLLPGDSIPGEARIEVNGPVLLFSLAISLATGILFGLAPALRCSRPNLVDTLKDGGKGSSGSVSGKHLRRGLVMAEVALSVILLAAASLAIRSFSQLMAIDPGFRTDHTLMVQVPLPPKQYKTVEQRNEFARNLLDSVSGAPGVQSVALGNGGMPFGGYPSAYTIPGQLPRPDNRIAIGLVSSAYLRTLGIALKLGRSLTPEEVNSGAHLALVNETAAKLWNGRSPIGGTLKLDSLVDGSDPQVLLMPGASSNVTVIGVVADTRNAGLREVTQAAAFVPYTLVAPPTRMLAVRTSDDPMLILNTLRRRVRLLDSELPLSQPITLREILGYETAAPKFVMALFSCFAALGLMLAAAGIYSVISYDVSQRVHEIGVRVALGATRFDVVASVLRSSLKVVALGMLIGLGGSLGAVRLIRSQIFSNAPFDVLSMLAICLLLSVVALFAALVPARRAGKLDPLTAMRYEA